jgi:hypothetical protein
MFPEDRVLVGAIKRKKDVKIAQAEGWYRIPQQQMPRGVHAEYLAFFLKGRVAGEKVGGIYYFAEVAGVELAYRRDLLPDEAQHPRADDVYYKVQLRNWQPRQSPVLNPTNRVISFIYTTWDRFVHAREISDLYSSADYYVDRIFHVLRNDGIRSMERYWEAERQTNGAQLRILCERGSVFAVGEALLGRVHREGQEDEVVRKIREQVAAFGGPLMIDVPFED